MIRSSKHTIKFANKNKQNTINKLLTVYKLALNKYIDLIINNKLPFKSTLTSKELPDIQGITHSQWKQVIFKQAYEIIQSNYKKINSKQFKRFKKLYYKCKKYNKHQKFLNKKYKELNINILKHIKVNLNNISINLDQRLVDFNTDSSFDEFIRIKLPWFQVGKKRSQNIKIPIKYHKHSLKFKKWKRLNTVKLNNHNIILSYEKEIKDKIINKNKSIGIDIGYKKLISDSNGKFYGKELFNIYQKITRKKRHSKAYNRALIERTNITNKIANKFYKDNNFDVLVHEDLKNVKHKSKLNKNMNNKLQYWSYRTLIDKLKRLSNEEGFLIINVEPAYTSQQCSKCGNINKNSRNGENYLCASCGYKIDADYNAAINIYNKGVYNLLNNLNENYITL